jgi:LEA14-like dessication related protein
MKLRLIPTLLLVALLSLSSCKIYQDVDVIEVENVIFSEFDNEGAEAEVWLKIKNPNAYKVVLTDSDVDLYFEGNHLGKVQLVENMVVPKKSLSTQIMKVEVEYNNMETLMGNFFTLLFKENFLLEAKGQVTGKALFVSKKVAIDFKDTLTREELGL